WTVTVNPNNGTVTATPPANAEPGTSVDIPVKVTYPDGSVDNTTTNVRVVPNDAQENTPGYNGGSTKPGVGVNIPQTGDTQLPPNTRFEIPQGGVPSGWTVTVNPNNGTVTATPPADAEPGTSVDIPVRVTYPDGSVDNTTTNVRVVPNDAQENTPGYNGGSTKPGVGVNIPQSGDTQLPPNTRFEIPQGGVPSGWTVTVNPN
ncbi:YPDG domain-containing protein, partial [Staphylococcus felis]|uniref:YPDG domain-containing protein n=1 Tax=Staphylococcus felis TaxID=46127 RepID=UPI000E3929D4